MIQKILLILSLCVPILLFSQTIDIDAMAEPFPTPFISEWRQNSGIFNLIITNNTEKDISIDIKGEIQKDGKTLGNGTKTNIELKAYEVKNLDNIDFLDVSSWDYDDRIVNNILKTGRIPEGKYEICFSYFENYVLVEKNCIDFEIVIPEIPDLISPIDEENISDLFPRFEWTPSFAPTEMDINYSIKMCLKEDNENPYYSITKVPILEKNTNKNSLIYPMSSPPLENGKTYVWQIQLLDENSNPIGENEGKSEIGVFSFGSISVTGEILSVNDGPEDDIDWSNDSLIYGNWTGESEEFYCAVGSEAGNTDLLPWTFAGAMTSFNFTRTLAEGSKYYISVKAGIDGNVMTSDGCEIDMTAPVSAVDSLADSLQTPFDVKWSGSDNGSGIVQYIIQSKVGDSSFVDWATIDDSTKNKSFVGKTGNKYYFRSKAIDLAGNVEEFPDSADAETYVEELDDSTYILVPNVAYLKITDSTEVKKDKGKIIIKGQVKLIIEPTPFDNFTKMITLSDSSKSDSSGITFEKNVVTNALEPIEGKFSFSDSSGIKKVYKDVFKIVAISFDSKRPTNSKMMVDSAFIVLPFKIPSQGETNVTSLDSIPITAAGLAFNKNFDKKFDKFGMIFTIKKLALAVEAFPPYIEAKVNVKLKKSSTDKTENFATNATIGFRGTDDIFAHIVPDSIPMRLIPGKDYVMMDSIWFEKPDDEWKLGVALQFKYPEPLDSITEQSKVNIVIGDDGFDIDLALINEERKSTYDANDKTAFRISNYFAMDLTNVDLKLVSVQKNGGMELDQEHSYVEFMADVYLGKGTPKRIAIGDPDEDKAGFKITFDGDTKKPGFKVKDNPFDIGPIRLSGFTNGAGLGIDFEPFEISLSGGLGINKPGTFEGTVNFENLVINKNGLDFSDFEVLGGDITVMDVITASIDSIGYSGEPTTLSFKEPNGDSTTVNKTVEVDSYFRLAGASLALNLDGDGGGGGCEEFLLYEVDNNTNIVIREAWFEVKNTCRLTADLKYVEEPEPLLSFGGSAEVKSSGIQGVAIGKIGKRGGKPTFGIFMAVSGLNANLGPVTLDEIGGGIFYRPLQSDIDQVKTMAGLKKGSLMQNDISELIQGEVPTSDNLDFAILLYAGMYAQSRDVFDGNGLITLTDNYFELLAKAKMMKNEAEGNLQLLVSWDPGYAEGFIGFKMNRKKVIKIDQNIEFFTYSDEVPGLNEDIWAMMGNGNVEVFPSTLSGKLATDFFLGPPGFYFDVDIEKEHDFWIIDGSYSFGTMFWWQKNVSWGAYADVSGSLSLDHVAGVGCSLEGALIGVSDDILLYSVGSFRATVMGEDIYNGSIWVSLGTDGTHGGKGRNSTYDGYIEGAKNMADNMKDEINNLSGDIESAKTSATQLTNDQRLAAGESLYNIVANGNIVDIQDIKTRFQNDINNFNNPNISLRRAFNNYLFFNEVQTLINIKEEIENDSLKIDNDLTVLHSNSDVLINRLNNYSSRVTSTLPQLAQTITLSNPVDQGEVVTVNIDGNSVNIPVNGTIDTDIVNQNTENTNSFRENIIAYKDSMLAQANIIVDDLIYADSILYIGNVSVNSLSIDYYKHSHNLSNNSVNYIKYYDKMMQIYSKSGQFQIELMEPIEQNLNTQANNIDENQLGQLIDIRFGIINYLLRKAGRSELMVQDVSSMSLLEKKDYCISLGQEVWYNIPYNGMNAIRDNTVNEINSFTSNYDISRNQFFQNWGIIANRVESIHNVKSKTYQYLYDFYDDLSWEFENGGPNKSFGIQGAVFNGSEMDFGGFQFANFNGGPTTANGNQNNFANFNGGSLALINGTVSTIATTNMLNIINGIPIGTAAKKLRDFESYSAKRNYIGSISTTPIVKNFSVNFDSDEDTRSYYGILSLDYLAEHSSKEGCFYNIDIPNVTPGQISLGIGQTPSFHLFRNIDSPGTYSINLTSFANTGYNISSSISIPVDYYYTPFEGHGGEFHSEGNFDDTSKPLAPIFLSANYLSNDDELLFQYHSEDAESGISEYQYAVADSVWYEYISFGAAPQRKYNIVRDWKSSGGREENHVKGLNLTQGDTYYILAKAKNGKDLWSSMSLSEKITVDKTAPSDFTIVDFQINTSLKMQKTKRYELIADWTNSYDPDSDVLYILGLGTSKNSDNLIKFGPVYNNQSYLKQQFTIKKSLSNKPFHLTIKAINSSGLLVKKTQSINLNKKKGR